MSDWGLGTRQDALLLDRVETKPIKKDKRHTGQAVCPSLRSSITPFRDNVLSYTGIDRQSSTEYHLVTLTSNLPC